MSQKFADKVRAIPKQTLMLRLSYCAGMLHLNDLLTDAERRKIHDRMMKRKAKEAREAR